MKKYDMSFVDFSEVAHITADEERLQNARDRLTAYGLLTEKGNPSPSRIGALAETAAPSFLDKLHRRLARRHGGIRAVRDTLQMLCGRKEYTAVFLYLAFWYGFLEWQVAERIALLPASPEAMKCFALAFLDIFDQYLSEVEPKEESA